MSILVTLLLATPALAAAAFVCWPLLRDQRGLRPRILTSVALAAVVVGVGGGTYLLLGSPSLAVRTFAEPSPRDLPALVSVLAQRVRGQPNDPRGWTLLGRGYLTLSDPVDAAAAFKRAVQVAPSAQRPVLLSAYGESLTLAAGGIVTEEAESAFGAAYNGNRNDFAARYYLGLAHAARHDSAGALTFWRSLLADAPPGATWRAELVDHIAALTSQTGTAPDIGRMVASLASRLKSEPNDPEGWQRLIRSYAVLGARIEARNALATARRALQSDRAAQAKLSAEARALRLE